MRLTLPLSAVLVALSSCTALAQASLNTGSAAIQTATPANSSHAAGTSIGGLFSFPLARAPGGSGDVMQVLWTSTGGSTGAVLAHLWDAKPTNTTCTDNTAFVESAVDDQHLIAGPFAL